MGSASSVHQRALPDDDFPKLGVQLARISDFIAHCGGPSKLINMTTTDVCETFLKPMTAHCQLSLCEMLYLENNPFVGTAQVFISHAWKFRFLEVVEALMNHFHDAPDIVVWFDLFSNNQHNTSSHDFNWWCNTFKSAIADFGHVVMVLTPWHDPIPLTRGWCLFELYCSAANKVKFEVAMTKEQRDACLESLTSNAKSAVAKMLARIDCERSETFNPLDKEQIFDVVRRTVGFAKVNSMVFDQLWQWITSTIALAIDREVDELAKVKLAMCLAQVVKEHGDGSTAEQLFEYCLQVRRRMMGNEHPDTLEVIHALVAIHMKYTTVSALIPGRNKNTDLQSNKREEYENNLKLHGETAPETLTSMRALADIYCCNFHFDLAHELFTKRLEILQNYHGEGHPDTILAMSDLARWHHDQGHFDQSKVLLEKVVLNANLIGYDNRILSNDVNKLAFIYCEHDQIDDCESLFQIVIAPTSAALGENHPSVLMFWENYATMFMAIKNYHKAIELLTKLLNRWTVTLGENHQTTVNTRYTLACCHDEMNRQPAAIQTTKVLPKKFVWYYGNDINEPRVWYSTHEGNWREKYPDGGEGLALENGIIEIPGDRYTNGQPVFGMELRRTLDNGQRMFIPFIGEPMMWFRFKQTGSDEWGYLGEMKNLEY